MKVISKEVDRFQSGNSIVIYKFNTGHEYRVYNDGVEFAYTPKGNYTTQVTLRKLCRIASEWEDTQIQIAA